MAGSRCWSTPRRPRLNALPAAYSDHKSDHQLDHDCLVRALAALGSFRAAELAFEATLLGRFGAAELALGAALLGSFCAAAPLPEAATFDSAACLAPEAAALLGGFCAAALRPEAATFDSAACLAPATFTALLGIALSLAATALLLDIALAAARAFAAALPDPARFARAAAMLFG